MFAASLAAHTDEDADSLDVAALRTLIRTRPQATETTELRLSGRDSIYTLRR